MRLNKNGKRRPTVGGVLCLLLFAALGVWIIGIGFKSAERYKILSERCTEQTTGIVTAINTKKKEKEDKDGNKYYEEDYITTVTYYVDNEPYKVSVRDSFQAFEREEELVVCYAPDDPDISYLERRMPDNDQVFFTFLGFFCMGIGLMIFLVG